MTQDSQKSRTQKKQEAQMVEELAHQLVDLPESLINELPAPPDIQSEIKQAKAIQAFSARKRQIKYLSKLLRQTEVEPVLEFLEKVQNSRLRQNKIFNELERLRYRILHEEEEEQALEEAKSLFPALDIERIQNLAKQYRWTRHPRFSKEIFRQLNIAQKLTE